MRSEGGGGVVHIYMMEEEVHVMAGENIVKGIWLKRSIRPTSSFELTNTP